MRGRVGACYLLEMKASLTALSSLAHLLSGVVLAFLLIHHDLNAENMWWKLNYADLSWRLRIINGRRCISTQTIYWFIFDDSHNCGVIVWSWRLPRWCYPIIVVLRLHCCWFSRRQHWFILMRTITCSVNDVTSIWRIILWFNQWRDWLPLYVVIKPSKNGCGKYRHLPLFWFHSHWRTHYLDYRWSLQFVKAHRFASQVIVSHQSVSIKDGELRCWSSVRSLHISRDIVLCQ